MMNLLSSLLLTWLFVFDSSDALLRKPRKLRAKTRRPRPTELSTSGRRINKQTKLTESTLSEPYSSSCSELYYEQRLDHFSGVSASDGTTTFMQRYFICGEELFSWNENDPIFFYCGNEANVEDYIEFTGLMWENAKEYNALLVFAEHRYYGKSMPWSQDEIYGNIKKLKYATVDQALEDYATLIRHIKTTYNTKNSPLIGFGGSYGGMLATWFRMKYPQYMDGAIAGSSPVLQVYGLDPESDAYAFASVETKDASLETIEAVSELVSDDVKEDYILKAGLSSDGDSSSNQETCQNNLQASWSIIADYSESKNGRKQLKELFNLCTTPKNSDKASEIVSVIEEAIAYMGMSSFAYESNYITKAVLGVDSGLPAYPVSYACNKYLTDDLTSDTSDDGKLTLLTAVADFNSVFWDADGSGSCIDLDSFGDSFDDYLWDFLYCDSLLLSSGTKGGDYDMFWDEEWNADETISYCNEYYGINYDTIGGASVKYGGYNLYKSLSNVVFSNGDMDPWYKGGVLPDMTNVLSNSDSLESVLIEYNGHHADLMFSDDTDSLSLLNARLIQKKAITKWIEQSYTKSSMGICDAQETVWDKMKKSPIISAMNIVL